MKRLLLVCGVLFTLLGLGGWRLWTLSQRVPEFYEAALTETPSPEVRQAVAAVVEEKARDLVQEMQHSDDWSEEFTEDQINIWLAEVIGSQHREVLPEGVSEPRIKIVKGGMYIAFRLNERRVRGVVSCRLEPRITGRNDLTVTFADVRLGLVEIPISQLLAELAGQTQIDGWTIHWKRASEEDVVRLQLDQGQPIQPILQTVELGAKRLRVAGTRGPLNTEDPPLAVPLQTTQRETRRPSVY